MGMCFGSPSHHLSCSTISFYYIIYISQLSYFYIKIENVLINLPVKCHVAHLRRRPWPQTSICGRSVGSWVVFGGSGFPLPLSSEPYCPLTCHLPAQRTHLSLSLPPWLSFLSAFNVDEISFSSSRAQGSLKSLEVCPFFHALLCSF